MFAPVSIATIYLIAGTTAIYLSIRARETRGRISADLCGFAIAVAEWAFFSALESLAGTREYRLLWSQFAYLGTYGSVAFLLRFCVGWLNPRFAGWWMSLVWIVPSIMVVGAFTNDLHGLVWTEVRPSGIFPFIYHYSHGALFWFGVAYQYLVAAICTTLVVIAVHRRRGIYRKQAVLVLAGFVVAVTGNVIYISGMLGEASLDISPLALAITTGFLLAGISRERLLELLPAARHRVVDMMPDGLMVLDDQKCVVDWNQAALRLWGIDQADIMGRAVSELIPPWIDAVPDQIPSSVRITIDHEDEHGIQRHIEIDVRYFTTPRERWAGWIVIFHNLTELHATERRLQEANARLESLNRELARQAVHDGLTGLFNRSYLDEALPRELARAEREGQPVGLLILDIDKFKDVNDSYGHDMGDEVLVSVAELVRSQVRAGDIPCRYGGDEIVAVMPGATRFEALRVGERIRSAVESARLEGGVELSVSVGVSVYSGESESAADLFREADRALYRAKDRGRNCVVGAGSE